MLYARYKDRTNPRVHQEPFLPKAAGGPWLVLLLLLLLKLNLLSVPSDSYTPEILLPPISTRLLAHGNPVPHLFTFGQIFFSSGPQQQKCCRDEKDVLPAAGAQNWDATKRWNRQLQLAHCFMNWRRNFGEFSSAEFLLRMDNCDSSDIPDFYRRE